MLAVETVGLCKSFGDVRTLKDCDLGIPAGAAFGLLGPNGAGKSTLIRTLLGFVRPTSGKATVLGKDVVRQSLAIRGQVAYLPGDARLYRAMRGSSVIDMFSEMHPLGDRQASRAVADRLELEVRRRVAFMSTGMRQKLALSIVLGCRAPLLILDEPTANLDPDVRNEVLSLVREANQAGRTVVLSSHLFTDVERTCGEVALLRGGRIVATESLKGRTSRHIVTAKSNREAFGLAAPDEAKFEIILRRRPDDNLADQQIVLEIVGAPNEWMPWLASLNLDDVTITMANVETFYDAFSHSVANGIDGSSDSGAPSSSKPEAT